MTYLQLLKDRRAASDSEVQADIERIIPLVENRSNIQFSRQALATLVHDRGSESQRRRLLATGDPVARREHAAFRADCYSASARQKLRDI